MEYNILSYSRKSDLHVKNEDACFICDDYIIIADGMGGESDGEVASQIAVETIVGILSTDISEISSEQDIKKLAEKAIYGADISISDYIDTHPDSFGMGTTILLAIRRENHVYLSWCGDSHGYIYRDGKICSITKDHSYVQELVDSGQMTFEETFTDPNNNLITRFAGGGEETCNPDFCSYRLADSEILILCSDGLSGYCKPDEIAKTIKDSQDIETLPKQLFDLAVRCGSDDDFTIVILVPKSYCGRPTNGSKFGWFKKLFHGNP